MEIKDFEKAIAAGIVFNRNKPKEKEFEKVSNKTIRCLRCGKLIFKEFRNEHKYITCNNK